MVGICLLSQPYIVVGAVVIIGAVVVAVAAYGASILLFGQRERNLSEIPSSVQQIGWRIILPPKDEVYSTIEGTIVVTTDATGTWSANLVPNGIGGGDGTWRRYTRDFLVGGATPGAA